MTCHLGVDATVWRGDDWVWDARRTAGSAVISGPLLVQLVESNDRVWATSADVEGTVRIVTTGGLDGTVPATDLPDVLAFYVPAADTVDAPSTLRLRIQYMSDGALTTFEPVRFNPTTGVL